MVLKHLTYIAIFAFSFCSTVSVTEKYELLEEHRYDWRKFHGREFLSSPQDCLNCHTEERFCVRCHEDVKPGDHTEFWRRAGHGAKGRYERNCVACHTEDSCSGCHEISPPRSHTTNWGYPDFAHCKEACHKPLASSTCYTCHKVLYGGHP